MSDSVALFTLLVNSLPFFIEGDLGVKVGSILAGVSQQQSAYLPIRHIGLKARGLRFSYEIRVAKQALLLSRGGGGMVSVLYTHLGTSSW